MKSASYHNINPMGVMLAKIGRYWDCFEEVDEYEIEVRKVRGGRKSKRPELSEVGSTNNQEAQLNDEKELDLSGMQKLKPERLATGDKTFYSKNIVLDFGEDDMEGANVPRQADSTMSNININLDQPDDTQMDGFKAKLLKQKLQRIR